MLSEKELYNARGNNIKITCIDNQVIEGICSIFTQAIDNEPEIASISIDNPPGLIEIYLNEIKSIEEIK
jgi:hypothetical protein